MLSITEIKNILSEPDQDKRREHIFNLGIRFELGSDRKQLQPDEWNSIIGLLIEAATHESDANVREEIFTAMLQASTFNLLDDSINWDSLALLLPDLSNYDLETAIIILGATQQEKYLALITTYLTHKKPDVVMEAKNAIYEIEWLKEQNALKNLS